MNDTSAYIKSLLAQNQMVITERRAALFNEFIADIANRTAVKQILDNQKMLMDKWTLKNRIADILQQQFTIPNGTVGKPYEAKIDFIKLGWNDVIHYQIEGLDEIGLQYNPETELIAGTPVQSGDLHILLKFRVAGEADDSLLNEKKITLIINPNPKSLWKNIESNTDDPYYKADNVSAYSRLGDKHIVVASKRGRSHATAGGFRDDDFAFKHYDDTGWSIVVVADGAGSAKFSRQGSKLACISIIDFFAQKFTGEVLKEFDEILLNYKNKTGDDIPKKLSHFTYNYLSKAAYAAHQKLAETATKTETSLKDFHSTLIFTLFKKYEFGYVLLSFGVGDCPIAVLNKSETEVTLMNWLDVGEFGGGTRFVTMPEIFSSDKFSSRFKFKLMDDFSYLMLMTDGIYDPKFVVEANLEKPEKWKDFISDLQGNNEDNCKVDFTLKSKEMATQLSTWMDFWSPGNHDDRTLAIVF